MTDKKPTILDKVLPSLLTALLIAIAGLIWGGITSDMASSSDVRSNSNRILILESNQKHTNQNIIEIKKLLQDISKSLRK